MHRKLLALSLVVNMSAVGLVACESETDNKPTVEAKEPAPEEKKDDAKDGGEGAAAKADGDAKADGAAAGDATEVAIDPKASSIEWVGAKVTGDHKGGFKTFTGKVSFDKEGKLTGISYEVDTTSVFSDNEKLTGHLKSADFFDVETFPKATFTSTKIKEGSEVKTEDGKAYTHTVTGNMDLHGQKKSITFPAMIDTSGDKVVATTAFNINRFDFGIEYKGKPDDLIKKEVLLKIKLEAPKPAAK